jgi:hypothetical protein
MSDLDLEKRVGTCAVCGPDTPLWAKKQSYGHSWACGKKRREKKKLHQRKRQKTPSGRRRERLQRIYRLTPEQVESMITEQGDVCWICRRLFGMDLRPQIDHCHESGAVRGILCGDCNTGLGRFKDNIELMTRAIEYLQTHRDPASVS